MKKNLLFSGIIFFSLLYWFSEGATEGYIWADNGRRLMNIIISGNFGVGSGLLGYHGYRFLEVLGILTLSLFVWNLRTETLRDSSFSFIAVFSGSQLAGAFLYERVLMYVANGYLFKEAGWIFRIFGLEIPRYPWQDWTILIAGIILIIGGFKKK